MDISFIKRTKERAVRSKSNIISGMIIAVERRKSDIISGMIITFEINKGTVIRLTEKIMGLKMTFGCTRMRTTNPALIRLATCYQLSRILLLLFDTIIEYTNVTNRSARRGGAVKNNNFTAENLKENEQQRIKNTNT